MLFSYNWLQEFFKSKLPTPEKLADLLALHVFEVEGIEKKDADTIFDISILPQRGDCLGHQGLAREIGALVEDELLPIEILPIKKEQKSELKPLDVSITAAQFVPRYSAVVLEGVTIGPSPQWMQERLEALGINSINNVVDITNYIMLELGQPMHAFDYEKINGQKIDLRLAKDGEKLTLLDETELSLPQGVLVAEDSKGLIDLVGIKGGKSSSISSQTEHIMLQAAVFDRKKIYQTKKALGYSTAAADIYSHEIDPNLTVKALERALFLMSKFGGGKVAQFIDFYKYPQKGRTVSFSPEAITKLLGMQIPQAKIKSILNLLGFSTVGQQVKIPTWRFDVSIKEDVVEEVGRVYGYDKISPVFPLAEIAPPAQNMELFWKEEIRDTLKEAGYTESYTYSFVGKNSEDSQKLIELENPISAEFEYLRPSLLPNLYKAVRDNEKTFSQRDMRIFEIGTVFAKAAKNNEEHQKFAMVFSPVIPKGKDAFYEMKGIFEMILSKLGIAGARYYEDKKFPKCAKVFISETTEVGTLCEVSSDMLSKYDVHRQIVALEADFDKISKGAFEEREYMPPSKYPALLRDIALLVPLQVKVEDVLNIMEGAGGELIADIDLFDMYEGDELPSGKKNLAFHIVYQSKERTLTNQEVDALQTKIVKALEENPEWEIRS